MTEVESRLKAAMLLVTAAEEGRLPPIICVAGAVSLVWQAREWASGRRP